VLENYEKGGIEWNKKKVKTFLLITVVAIEENLIFTKPLIKTAELKPRRFIPWIQISTVQK